MKLILCSVFLAHGAVVYTVCAPVFGGLYRAPRPGPTRTFNVILGKSAARDRGLTQCAQVKIKNDSYKISDIKRKRHNRSPVPSCALAEYDGGVENGWEMDRDLSLKAERDIIIRFSVDARGDIKNVTVTPFVPVVYETVCTQLKKIHFTWRGTTPPPAYTTFEKKICIR